MAGETDKKLLFVGSHVVDASRLNPPPGRLRYEDGVEPRPLAPGARLGVPFGRQATLEHAL